MLDKGHSIALVWRERKNTRHKLWYRAGTPPTLLHGCRAIIDGKMAQALRADTGLDPIRHGTSQSDGTMEVTFQEAKTDLELKPNEYPRKRCEDTSIARSQQSGLSGMQALESNCQCR